MFRVKTGIKISTVVDAVRPDVSMVVKTGIKISTVVDFSGIQHSEESKPELKFLLL